MLMGDDKFIWGYVELEVPEIHLEMSRRKSDLRIYNSGGEPSVSVSI